MTNNQYSEFLQHHGVKGMHWGIRRYQPYPKGHKGGKEVGEAAKSNELQKTYGKDGELRYDVKFGGRSVSQLKTFDYKIKGFDYVLIADVETDKKYRRNGLATSLIKEAYRDVKKKNKGLYIFVDKKNFGGVKFYEANGFKHVKPYKLPYGEYYIMQKGNDKNIKQFDEMKFN